MAGPDRNKLKKGHQVPTQERVRCEAAVQEDKAHHQLSIKIEPSKACKLPTLGA